MDPKEAAFDEARIISDIANCHRQEQMWPIEGFNTESYMTRSESDDDDDEQEEEY